MSACPLKFGVGVMLTGFGTFWVGEGIGLEWLGADAAILALIAGYRCIGIGLGSSVHVDSREGREAARIKTSGESARPIAVAGVASKLFGLLVDDGWLAGVLIWVAAGWRIAFWRSVVAHLASSVIFAMGLFLVVGVSTTPSALA